MNSADFSGDAMLIVLACFAIASFTSVACWPTVRLSRTTPHRVAVTVGAVRERWPELEIDGSCSQRYPAR